MRSRQPCNQYVWRYLQHTCVRDNERMRKLFCRNEGNFTTLNPCGRWEPSLMMRPGCRFFYSRNSLLGLVGQTKEENLSIWQETKLLTFQNMSCPIWNESNWRLDWVTRSFFHHRDCIHPQEPWTNWEQLGRLGEVDGGALWDGEHQLGGGEGEGEQDGSELWFALGWENYQAEWSWCCLAP